MTEPLLHLSGKLRGTGSHSCVLLLICSHCAACTLYNTSHIFCSLPVLCKANPILISKRTAECGVCAEKQLSLSEPARLLQRGAVSVEPPQQTHICQMCTLQNHPHKITQRRKHRHTHTNICKMCTTMHTSCILAYTH